MRTFLTLRAYGRDPETESHDVYICAGGSVCDNMSPLSTGRAPPEALPPMACGAHTLNERSNVADMNHYVWKQWHGFDEFDHNTLSYMHKQCEQFGDASVVSALGNAKWCRPRRLAMAMGAYICVKDHLELPATPVALMRILAGSELYASECIISADEMHSPAETLEWFVEVIQSGILIVFVDDVLTPDSVSSAGVLAARVAFRINGKRTKRVHYDVDTGDEYDADSSDSKIEPKLRRARVEEQRARKRQADAITAVSASLIDTSMRV